MFCDNARETMPEVGRVGEASEKDLPSLFAYAKRHYKKKPETVAPYLSMVQQCSGVSALCQYAHVCLRLGECN